MLQVFSIISLSYRTFVPKSVHRCSHRQIFYSLTKWIVLSKRLGSRESDAVLASLNQGSARNFVYESTGRAILIHRLHRLSTKHNLLTSVISQDANKKQIRGNKTMFMAYKFMKTFVGKCGSSTKSCGFQDTVGKTTLSSQFMGGFPYH